MLGHNFFPADARKTRILDFDIENRPLSYWVPDKPTAEITAISSMWVGDHDSIEVLLLGELPLEEVLARFVTRYNEADIVTGHYIRNHDLPHINGALIELGLPILRSKLTSDTKNDYVSKGDIPATQEHLLEQFDVTCPIGLQIEKFHMSQAKWREANRLTPEGLALTKRRVSSDVHGHSHLREVMLERGLLSAPKVWRP